MRQTRDTVWQRGGTSWLWDAQALSQVCTAGEVWSLRRWLRAAGAPHGNASSHWPEDLPSNQNRALVVAGLDASLDVLTPDDAEYWLADVIKPGILSFQDEYQGEAALLFWLPGSGQRVRINSATDAVSWLCHTPYEHPLALGRLLWGEANEYPQEILLQDGGMAAGLFHRRIT